MSHCHLARAHPAHPTTIRVQHAVHFFYFSTVMRLVLHELLTVIRCVLLTNAADNYRPCNGSDKMRRSSCSSCAGKPICASLRQQRVAALLANYPPNSGSKI